MDAYSPKQPQQSQKTFIAIGLVVFAAVGLLLFFSRETAEEETLPTTTYDHSPILAAEEPDDEVGAVVNTPNEDGQHPPEDSVLQPDLYPYFPNGKCRGETDIHCFKEELDRFIADNLFYPEEAIERNEQGRVMITFQIDADGNVHILKADSRYQSLLEEGVRIIEKLPRLQPAYKDGKFVAYTVRYPINFKLE